MVRNKKSGWQRNASLSISRYSYTLLTKSNETHPIPLFSLPHPALEPCPNFTSMIVYPLHRNQYLLQSQSVPGTRYINRYHSSYSPPQTTICRTLFLLKLLSRCPGATDVRTNLTIALGSRVIHGRMKLIEIDHTVCQHTIVSLYAHDLRNDSGLAELRLNIQFFSDRLSCDIFYYYLFDIRIQTILWITDYGSHRSSS